MSSYFSQQVTIFHDRTLPEQSFLVAFDKLIASSVSESEIVELTYEQKAILIMSEQDITNEELISQEAMDKRNLKWLNAL